MKEIDGWVKIKKYTDDDGTPVCFKCVFAPRDSNRTYQALCHFGGRENHPLCVAAPGPSCPVWHGESKDEWQPIHGEPTEPGYYWWLPVCFADKVDDPRYWSIISWHPRDTERQKSGTFVGPLPPPLTEDKP